MIDADKIEQLAREETRPLSPRDIIARLHVPSSTVYLWIESGKLPARKVGGRWQIRPADLLAVIATPHNETS